MDEIKKKRKKKRPKRPDDHWVIKATSKQIQSNCLTLSRYDFDIYQKRALYYVIEALQPYFKDLNFNRYAPDNDLTNIAVFKPTLIPDIVEFTIPKSKLLGEDNNETNYQRLIASMKKLLSKIICFENDEERVYSHFISAVKENIKYSKDITFRIDTDIWKCIFNFERGFTKYRLLSTISLKSVYAMRLYEMVSNRTERQYYSLEELKDMFLLKNRYKVFTAFVKYVIEPAKAELDKTCDYTFRYEIKYEKQEGAGRPKAVGFFFYPIHQPQNDITAKSLTLTTVLEDQLKEMGFTNAEIDNNRALLSLFQLNCSDMLYVKITGKFEPEYILFLRDLEINMRYEKIANTKGYVINAIKKHTEEKMIQQGRKK